MSYTDADIQATQDLIGTLQNLEPDSPLVTLGNTHNKALRNLARILNKETYPERPPRMVNPEQHQKITEKLPDNMQTPNHV